MTVRITRPTTIVRTDAQGKVTRATNVGAIRHPMVTPTAMAKPEQAARVLQELQSALEHVADIVQSQHDTACVVFLDVAFGAGVVVNIQHGLGRAYQGWRIERPRGDPAFNPIEQSNAATPLTSFLLLKSTAAGIGNVVVW